MLGARESSLQGSPGGLDEVSEQSEAESPALAVPGREPRKLERIGTVARYPPSRCHGAVETKLAHQLHVPRTIVLPGLPGRIGEEPHRRARDLLEALAAEGDLRARRVVADPAQYRVIHRVRADRHARCMQPLYILRAHHEVHRQSDA